MIKAYELIVLPIVYRKKKHDSLYLIRIDQWCFVIIHHHSVCELLSPEPLITLKLLLK